MVSRGKVGNSQHFPTNLHILLDDAEKSNHEHIISWCSQGQAFKIHDQDAIVPLLAKYFRQTKFKSFLRQLQSYDFHRITRGSEKGVVSHPLFKRGRRSLCFRMTRKSPGHHSPSPPPIHHSMMSSTSILHRSASQNDTTNLRKAQSSPAINVSTPWNRTYTDISQSKNATFDMHSQVIQPQDTTNLARLKFHPTRRASASSVIPVRAMPYPRRSSAPGPMSSQDIQTIIECAKSVPMEQHRTIQDSLVLSLKKSSNPAWKESQEEPSRLHHQQHLQINLQQGQKQTYIQSTHYNILPQTQQSQQVSEAPNQVVFRHIQYQQGAEGQIKQEVQAPCEVTLNYPCHQPGRQHEVTMNQVQCQQQQQQQQQQQNVQLVYSQRALLNQIEELRQNFQKQLDNKTMQQQQQHQNVLLKSMEACHPHHALPVHHPSMELDGIQHQKSHETRPKEQVLTAVPKLFQRLNGDARVSPTCSMEKSSVSPTFDPLQPKPKLPNHCSSGVSFPIPSCDIDVSFSTTEFHLEPIRIEADTTHHGTAKSLQPQPIEKTFQFSGSRATSTMDSTPIAGVADDTNPSFLDSEVLTPHEFIPHENKGNFETGTVDHLLQNGVGFDEWLIDPDDHLEGLHPAEVSETSSLSHHPLTA